MDTSIENEVPLVTVVYVVGLAEDRDDIVVDRNSHVILVLNVILQCTLHIIDLCEVRFFHRSGLVISHINLV